MKKAFPRVVTILSKVRDLSEDEIDNLKIESLDCLVSFITTYPDLVTNDESLKVIINLVFKNMVELDDEIS